MQWFSVEMKVRFQVQTKIRKPLNEVFDAVRNPVKMSQYFTTGGASGPLEEGMTVNWNFLEPKVGFPVHVLKVVENKTIVLEWEAMDVDYKTQVEFTFESLGPSSTLVKISEGEWKDDQKGIDSSYGDCEGWVQMLCCLKAYLEYGINLREGYY